MQERVTEPELAAMRLGPFPSGDPAGMRLLARQLRFKAAIFRNSPGMIAEEFRALPIRAPFFSRSSLRFLGMKGQGVAAAMRLDLAAQLLETKADELQEAQAAWRRQKVRADEGKS